MRWTRNIGFSAAKLFTIAGHIDERRSWKEATIRCLSPGAGSTQAEKPKMK